jgi:hypothetical protein
MDGRSRGSTLSQARRNRQTASGALVTEMVHSAHLNPRRQGRHWVVSTVCRNLGQVRRPPGTLGLGAWQQNLGDMPVPNSTELHRTQANIHQVPAQKIRGPSPPGGRVTGPPDFVSATTPSGRSTDTKYRSRTTCELSRLNFASFVSRSSSGLFGGRVVVLRVAVGELVEL